MSFNPGWDSIFPDDDPQVGSLRQDSKPAEFVRIVQAIQPDVLCLQEINVDLPDADYAQDLYLICAHFKALGGQANVQARQAHADAIVQWLADLQIPGGQVDLPTGTPVIVLGDLNVYDTDPAYHLTTLLTGEVVDEATYGPDVSLDWDGTALTDALPRHNATGGDTYTWRDDTQEFNPGVLDHILCTDSVLSVEHAFVLNTLAMTEADLEAAGLQAGDVLLDLQTRRYDHLPLVVDLALRAAGGVP